ncbi:hypothetical protein [Bosea thiooxidans]
MDALGISPNSFGMAMVTATYSPDGAAWVDALATYLDGNRKLLRRQPQRDPRGALDAAQIDLSRLGGLLPEQGMEPGEFTARVEKEARIAVDHGPSFGAGGESFLRFNLAASAASWPRPSSAWSGLSPISNK